MNRFCYYTLGILLLCTLTGCAGFLAGATALGGVTIGMDTMRLERNITTDQAWDAAQMALQNIDAQITSQDRTRGIISATAEDSDLTITITKQDTLPTWIDIKCRRNGLPNLELANHVLETINTSLRKK